MRRSKACSVAISLLLMCSAGSTIVSAGSAVAAHTSRANAHHSRRRAVPCARHKRRERIHCPTRRSAKAGSKPNAQPVGQSVPTPSSAPVPAPSVVQPGAASTPLGGTIVVADEQGAVIASAAIGEGDYFEIPLSPGSYRVSGTRYAPSAIPISCGQASGPSTYAAGAPVTVLEGQTTDVYCAGDVP
jgi:hypothetical protein